MNSSLSPAVCAAICLAVPAAAQPFSDRSAELGLSLGNTAAAWADVDNDGWPDLYCAGNVWMNDQGNRFTPITANGSGVIADIDNDGDGDLVSFAPIAIYRNTAPLPDASPAFVSVALPELPETSSRGCAVGDYNGDGLLDAYFGGYESWEPQITYPDLLLLANGAGGYTLAINYPDFRARGVTACDFDEDNDLDIYISNYRLMPNVLWVNDGHGAFINRAPELNAVATSEGFGGGHSIGACWGDFDNDGHFDLFAGNFAHVDSRGDQPKSRFLRSRGPRPAPGPDGKTTVPFSFEDLHECGVWYQESYASPASADFDNDGDLDLFFTTVYATASFGRKNHAVLYRNDGDWTFTDVTAGSGLEELPPTYQAAWADFDSDGDLDLATAGRLYVNESAPTSHWLEVRLTGDGAKVNTSAIGAQVRIALPDGRVLTRQVEAGTGEGNANDLTLHFGLGSHADPVNIKIRWPDGSEQTLPEVQVDQTLAVTLSSDK